MKKSLDVKEQARIHIIRGLAEIARAFDLPGLDEGPRPYMCAPSTQRHAWEQMSALKSWFETSTFRARPQAADAKFQRYLLGLIGK